MTGLFVWLIVIGIIVSKVMKQSGNSGSGGQPGGGNVYRTAQPQDGDRDGAAQSAGNDGNVYRTAQSTGGGQTTQSAGNGGNAYRTAAQSAGNVGNGKENAGNVYRTAAQSGGNAGGTSQAAKKSGDRRVMTDADRARLEEYRRKKAKSASSVGTNQMRSAAQPDIVERAKANSRKYAGRDETLEELEREHKHSERVGSAVADYVERERQEHMRMHTEPAPKVEDTSLLGPVEDLMVKGFDGNLSFERDFVGEAADMIAGFLITDQWQPE